MREKEFQIEHRISESVARGILVDVAVLFEIYL